MCGRLLQPEGVAKLLGRFFLPFTDFAAINDDVVLAGRTVDPDSAEGKVVEADMRLLAWVWSRALLGDDDGEGGHALLHFLTGAVRAQNLVLLVVYESQDSRK
jgi:hypothetical protein